MPNYTVVNIAEGEVRQCFSSFFESEKQPVWRQYMEELGIQKAIVYLKDKGLPCEWPEKVVNLTDPATLKATVTASLYKSQCPYYDGYWLCGGIGSVECTAAGELLPGNVWYEVCSKEHYKCPFYKKENIHQGG